MPVEPASVRLYVCAFTLSNINNNQQSYCNPILSEALLSGGGGGAALGFGPDRIGTLVFMATDSSHRVIMEKILLPI